MAFNPFHKFRKHKKAIFAFLTIFCMFSFVLCSGVSSGGDFASWFSQSILRRAKKDQVATIDGSGVTATDLYHLRHQRMMANTYMMLATQLAFTGIQREIQSKMTPGSMEPQIPKELEAQINVLRENLSRSGGAVYFGGSPKYPNTELLDFMLWQKQADRLGIYLSEADLNQEIIRLTLGRFSKQDGSRVFAAFTRPDTDPLATQMGLQQDMREIRPYFSEDALCAALIQEFRVRMAQEALGYQPGGSQPDGKPVSPIAAASTPQEFWTYFDDNVKKVEVNLLPVKVEDFVAKVTGSPTEQEIKDLYSKYRDKLSEPDSPTPGFKQPRRVQMEYVGAKHDAAEFTRLAKEFRKASGPAITAAAAIGQAAIGTSSPFLVATDLAAVPSYELRRRLVLYQEATKREGKFLTPFWVGEGFLNPPSPLHDTSWKQPEAAVALVGVNFGLAGTPAAPFGAPAAFEAYAVQKEMADRVRFGSTMVLDGTMAVPLPIAALAVESYGMPSEPYLPYDQVKHILEQIKENREKLDLKDLRDARNRVFETMKKEVAAPNKAKDQAMIDAYVADMIQRYGLEHGKSADPGSDYTTKFRLADDKALQPLKEAFGEAPSLDPTGNLLGQYLLRSMTGVYQPQEWPFLWETADRAFLYWLTKDQKDEVVRLDDPKLGKQVRAEVEKAWRFTKARELAKKEADNLLEQARKEKGNKKGLTELSKGTLIELDPIGNMNRQPSPDPTQAYRYQAPRISETKVPYSGEGQARFDQMTGRMIPPPVSTFAKKVVELRTKPIGEGTVIPDKPEAVYYVAVLVNVDPPSERQFFEAYRDAASNAKRKDPLFTQFEFERGEKFQKELLERLRRDFHLEKDEEALKKFGGSGSSGPGDE